MASFSERKGFTAAKAIQKDSIDEALRNGLWTALSYHLWDRWESGGYGYQSDVAKNIERIFWRIWVLFFKKTADTLPPFAGNSPERSGLAQLRDFFFKTEWNRSFDLIEFVLKNVESDEILKELRDTLNFFLERENSGYRVVDTVFVDIVDDAELKSIETAIESGTDAAKKHLRAATEFLTDRKNPDFRNAIKEAISAVEATCQTISGDSKATLGDALKIIKTSGYVHPAFEKAVSQLYGYTNDSGGIRHALTETGSTPSYSEGKFMLVTCSAFINYVWGRAAELGIKIPKA